MGLYSRPLTYIPIPLKHFFASALVQAIFVPSQLRYWAPSRSILASNNDFHLLQYITPTLYIMTSLPHFTNNECFTKFVLSSYPSLAGIEIHRDVIDHCQNALKTWSTKKSQGVNSTTSSSTANVSARSCPHIIHGNGLCISTNDGESLVGFDRIYIGAAIERGDLARMSKLLSPGGILVAPGTWSGPPFQEVHVSTSVVYMYFCGFPITHQICLYLVF